MKKVVLIIALTTTATCLQGSVLLHEPFNYVGTVGAGGSTGIGWDGDWSDAHTVIAGDQTVASGYVFQGGAGSGYVSYPSSAGDANFNRPTTAVIDFGSDNTYYMSTIFDQSAGGGSASAFNLVRLRDADNNGLLRYGDGPSATQWGLFADDNASLDLGTSVVGGGGNAVVFVMKIETTAAGSDTFFYKTYAAGDTITGEPLTWDGSASITSSSTLGRVQGIVGSAGDSTIDEILIGQSFADVTGVPEPGTTALFAGIAVLGLLTVRRRLRAA